MTGALEVAGSVRALECAAVSGDTLRLMVKA
jgi:hypothetical protein